MKNTQKITEHNDEKYDIINIHWFKMYTRGF